MWVRCSDVHVGSPCSVRNNKSRIHIFTQGERLLKEFDAHGIEKEAEVEPVLWARITSSPDRGRQTDFVFGGSRPIHAEIGPFGEQQSALKLSHSGNVTCHAHLSSARAPRVGSVPDAVGLCFSCLHAL